tara:strand:- start:186 stop:587 length:402 start_codon:yes stop_codon:yes gene_type:complete
MKSLRLFLKNIQNILVYSDSELLEFALVLVLVIVNPLNALSGDTCTPSGWFLVGLMGGLIILRGLGTSDVKCRETGMLLALVNLTALNVIEIRHCDVDPGNLLQNLVIAFTWWKLGKERMTKEFRGRCGNGTK